MKDGHSKGRHLRIGKCRPFVWSAAGMGGGEEDPAADQRVR